MLTNEYLLELFVALWLSSGSVFDELLFSTELGPIEPSFGWRVPASGASRALLLVVSTAVLLILSARVLRDHLDERGLM